MCYRLSFSSALLLVAIGWSTQAPAALLDWTIDTQQSYVRLSLPMNQNVLVDGLGINVRLRNPDNSNWSDAGGRASRVAGTFSTSIDLEAGTLTYLSGFQSIQAVEFGSFRPNPAAFDPSATNSSNPSGQYTDTSGAPAAFALLVSYNPVDINVNILVGYLTLREVSYTAEGTITLSESGGALVGTGGTFGIDSGILDMDGLVTPLMQQYIPDTRAASLASAGMVGQQANSGAVSYRQLSQTLHELDQLISIPVVLEVESATTGRVPISGALTGRIVAYAVPEPASGGLAMIAIGLAVWRRRPRGPLRRPLE